MRSVWQAMLATAPLFHLSSARFTSPSAHLEPCSVTLVPLLRLCPGHDSARHVRCLHLKGFSRLNIDAERPSVSEDQLETSHDDEDKDEDTDMQWLKSRGVDEILEGDEPVFSTSRRHVSHGESVIQRSSSEDLAWTPVPDLIRILPGLVILEYECRNQFPPLLLDAIQERQCKLHHRTFRLRSLVSDITNPFKKKMLATSPYLHKVQLRRAWRDSNGYDNFNQEAIMELMAGLAPNLKEFVVINLSPPLSSLDRRRPRGSWQGLRGSGIGIGSLTSLALLGAVDWSSEETIQKWAEHTDFRCLHHLSLGGGYSETEMRDGGVTERVMEWIVENLSFPRLESFRINLDRDGMMEDRPNYADKAIALLRRFEPLEELSIAGALEPKILDAILARHGPALRRLSLRPSESMTNVANGRIRRELPMIFDQQRVLQISAQCPALRQLAIPVKRTQCETAEAAIYKSFGKIACLQSLFLTLDCSDWRATRDTSNTRKSFDAFDRESFEPAGFLAQGPRARDVCQLRCG